VPTFIYIYCPAGISGLSRDDLEDELTEFFGDAALDVGAGSGTDGFNLDYELAESADAASWIEKLTTFLKRIGVKEGTFFDVHTEGRENETLRVHVQTLLRNQLN
jgi:hypothetical protein